MILSTTSFLVESIGVHTASLVINPQIVYLRPPHIYMMFSFHNPTTTWHLIQLLSTLPIKNSRKVTNGRISIEYLHEIKVCTRPQVLSTNSSCHQCLLQTSQLYTSTATQSHQPNIHVPESSLRHTLTIISPIRLTSPTRTNSPASPVHSTTLSVKWHRPHHSRCARFRRACSRTRFRTSSQCRS